MLKSKQVILPVFYGVNPEDLRNIDNGPFKEGFQKHFQRDRKEEIPKWEEALCKVADYRGFRLDEVNGDEEQLIRSILTEVRNAMPATLLPAKQQYGLKDSMWNVMKMLNSVTVLGLVAMGGIGKTTLALEIYNHFVSRRQFERYCFLRDVRSSQPSELQRQLMRDLGHHSEVQSISPADYKRAFDGLTSQRVLIVVYDIDHSSQFAALIPDIEKLGPSSRIMITSRQKDVLKHAMGAATCENVYDVPLMSKSDSRLLFNRHAFLSETPSEGFADLAVEVADACGGHPLSLETIGASLFDKREVGDREVWMEAVKALQGNEEIFGKLRSTYDSLPMDGDRAMFRDIACMLIGMKKEVALAIWKSCESCSGALCSTFQTPVLGLRRLMDRSLVRVDDRGRFRMHDVLRDMGRDIVKKEAQRPEMRTHLWDAGTAQNVLRLRKRNTSIRGINMGIGETLSSDEYTGWQNFEESVVSCEVSLLASMKELHLLRLDGCHVVVADDFSSWPQELRWLQWRSFCFSTLPSHLHLPCLVVLDLSHSDKLTHLWKSDADIQLPLLQTLDLTGCGRLEELTENVGQSAPKLNRLVLGGCTRLRRLPKSIGQLTDLEHLNLDECRKLVALPDTIVGLVSLRTLVLQFCDKLKQLPKEFGKLINLETLDVCGCSTLSDLPASIGGLRMLKTLKMEYTKVPDLPEEFGLLTSLTILRLPQLRSVPQTFQALQSLTALSLKGGSADMGDLGALTALKYLHFWKHATITTLPKSMGSLKWLARLQMRECHKLLTVEALPEGLELLDLSYCSNLVEIPSLATMRYLLRLYMRDCRSLRHAHGLECLTTLVDINISGCISIEGCRINANALRECDVRRSRVSVAYNNKWLEREPGSQLITYLDDAIPLLPNGMSNDLVLPKSEEWALVLEASISSKAECIGLVWCLVTNSYDMGTGNRFYIESKVEVWRGGRLVIESTLTLYHRDRMSSQVWLWTTRREDHAVQSLQYGDQICFLIRPSEGDWTVVEGAVCVVFNEDDNLLFAVNSEMLSKSQSETLATQFGQLLLEDKDEQLASATNSGLLSIN